MIKGHFEPWVYRGTFAIDPAQDYKCPKGMCFPTQRGAGRHASHAPSLFFSSADDKQAQYIRGYLPHNEILSHEAAVRGRWVGPTKDGRSISTGNERELWKLAGIGNREGREKEERPRPKIWRHCQQAISPTEPAKHMMKIIPVNL